MLLSFLFFGLTLFGATLEASITGSTEDATGAPVPGAIVKITCGAEVRETVSNAEGHFALSTVPSANCVITAENEAFGPTQIQLKTPHASSVRLVLPLRGFESHVTVTAARGEREESFDIPEAAAGADADEIVSRPYQTLPQVLREEVGILVQQTTAAQASPLIRGFTGQRNVYLLDGVRFNTAAWRSGPSQYLAWLGSAQVNRMEIIRGPGSVQYGSDALGGTINVLTAVPALSSRGVRVGGDVEGAVASGDSSAGFSASGVMQAPAFAVRIGGSTKQVDDLRPGGGRDSHAAVTRFLGLPSGVIDTRLPNTGFEQRGGFIAGQFAAGASGHVTAVYRRDQQTGVSRHDRTLGGDGLYRSGFVPQQLDFGFVRYERNPVKWFDSFEATMSVNRQQDGTIEQARPMASIDTDGLQVTALGYQVQVARRLADRHRVMLGAEAYDEDISSFRILQYPDGRVAAGRPQIPDASRYLSIGAFGQATSEFVPGRVLVRGGLRYGAYAFRTGADPAFSIRDERVAMKALTFNSGLVLSLTDSINATVNVSRGFRAPNAFDLGGIGFGAGAGFEISPDEAVAHGALIGTTDGQDAISTARRVQRLGAEALYAFEGGLKFHSDRLTASLTGFQLELVDTIQRRTAIFPVGLSGTSVGGQEIVQQDAFGRAFVARDARPIVTRVNVDRARVRGVEADAAMHLSRAWVASAWFALADGRELASGEFLRRMPPPLGGASLTWRGPRHGIWVQPVVTFARPQTRMSPGDLGDARIGARRSRAAIASFFNGTAMDLGLVRDGVLLATGETLTDVQARLLGTASNAPLYTSTPGFAVIGLRGGVQLAPRVGLTLIAENLTDRNYRLHGSGVDAPGFNLQLRTQITF